MKKNIKIAILVLFLGLYGCELKSNRQKYAEMLIKKVEAFEEFNNRLPKDVIELELTEEINSPAFYQKVSDSTYIIWYGVHVGESKIYKSSTKTWTE